MKLTDLQGTALHCLPQCGVCGHEVERLVEYYDEHCRRVVFVAYCHGQRERVDVHCEELEQGPISVSAGVAFRVPPQLPAKQ